MKTILKSLILCLLLSAMIIPLIAQQEKSVIQSEEEFQRLMPITGTVNTFFGDFELDHSFPAVGEASASTTFSFANMRFGLSLGFAF